MWMVLVEVRQKGIVSEMEQARSVISHNVGVPWDEESAGAVAVKPLVGAGFGTEERGDSRLGDRSFVVAAKRWRVVRPIFDGAVREVEGGRHDAELGLAGSLFEGAVCDSPRRVCHGHEVASDVRWELESPNVGLEVLVVEDPP